MLAYHNSVVRIFSTFISATFLLTVLGASLGGCAGSSATAMEPAGDSTEVSAARAAANTYRESVNKKDLELLRTIFADDVVLSVPTMAMDLENPDGVFHGIEEAMAFFGQTSFKAQAILTYTHVYEDGNSCVVELKGRLPGGNDVEALDIFTVNDEGLVIRMTVYARIAT